MRARVYSNGGISTGGFTFNGGQLTGALILAGNPSDPLEAAAKQYVDSSLVNLNASNLTSGILPAGRLPAFSGDIIKPAGSSSINLAPIGIVAGDYTKPTIDAKGRVTAGAAIVEADLPNISWNKVTTGKPTTVEGYGITDALTTAGGTLSGFLTFNGSITGTMQAVTKQYVDVTLSSSTGIAIGDIIRKPYGTTPAGFLKCNGALVSKTTYNALYATIGDRFSKNMVYHGGQPWRLQYNINDSQVKDINDWNISTSLPVQLYTPKAIVTKNRVYLLGGANSSVGPVSTVYTAPINVDGTLGTWTTGTSLPGILAHSSVAIIKNRVYLLGGWESNVVYTAAINSDGTLGTWSTGTSLPIILRDSSVLVTNNRIYLLGGGNSTTAFSTVYTALINSDGTLGTWSTGTSLPSVLIQSQAVVTKNRVYLLGGKLSSGGPVSTVYTAPINSDGTLGTWSTGTSLPEPIAGCQAIITKNRVYLLGGGNSTTAFSTVYTALINSDGTLGTWATGTALPGPLSLSSVIVTKNHIYLLGGYNTQSVSTVYVATFSGGLNDYSSYYADDNLINYMMPGSGKPWQQQYQINQTQTSDITGWTTTTSLPVPLHVSQAIVTKNRVYLIGGVTTGNVATSSVYTAPINADGSLGSWTEGISLPIAVQGSSIIVTKNRVYLLGGNDGIYIANAKSTVYTALINSDGTLGTWTAGTSLPTPLYNSQAIVTKNRVYLLGGYNETSTTNVVYSAPINSDGTLGTWTTNSPLPITFRRQLVFITKNRIYLLGGIDNYDTLSSDIYTAKINSDGFISIWEKVGILPQPLYRSQAIVTKNRVYLLGGNSGTTPISTVYTASIDADGMLGSWTTGTSLSAALESSQVIITKNRVFLLGGVGAGDNIVSTVYTANILSDISDYSPYYDGTIVPVEPINQTNLFALPDLTQSEKFDTVSYIKY